MTVLAIALAAGLGSAARFVLESAISARAGTRWPWGLLVVNVSGSFALGLVVGSSLPDSWTVVLGVGFLGGYTTMSAAGVAAAQRSLRRDDAVALAGSMLMLVSAVAAAALGVALA